MNKLFSKNFILYVFFAILISGLNILIYLLSYNYIVKSIIIGNIFAYSFSIITSFFINKKVVFKSDSKNIKKEFISYLGIKFISFIIDSVTLFLFHDVIGISNFISKIISNSITVINNYIFNKIFVFKK